MESYTVNAVVVTHERPDLLQRCVNALLEQSRKPDRIIIVDNASTDGTKAYLKSIRKDPLLEVICLKKNMGGAGGFYHGIKRACEIGCDYIWIMDDDTVAEKDALQKLLDALEILKDKKVGFLASNVLYRDGKPCHMNVSKTVPCWNEFIREGIVEVSHTSFVAMLIPSGVVRKIGLPIKEYFIWGDDVEYSTRILRAGYSGYQVGGSTVLHLMEENIGVDIFHTPKERIGRYFYFYRNLTTTARMRGAAEFFPRLGWHAFIIAKILFGKTDHRILKSMTVLHGTICGIFQRVKIRYAE